MSLRTSYAPGTPSWVDIGSPDPQGAAAFYGALFGWVIEFDSRPEAGGYAMCMLNGVPAAGMGPQMNPDMPPFWAMYVTVVDAAATMTRVAELGGTVIVPDFDVLDVGRMGILQDPTGAFISVWQPLSHIGSGVVNEPGAFVWNEISTPNIEAATSFYGALFGWGLDTQFTSPDAAGFTVAGELVCGGHTAGEGEFPAWSVWFAVDDCDASAARVVELGGTIVMPPSDLDFGRGAVVTDPYGAVFGIGKITNAV